MSLFSGDIEDYPGLSSLTRYQVEEEGGSVYVQGYPGQDQNRRERYEPGVRVVSDNNVFLVVGGGAAGQAALETLR